MIGLPEHFAAVGSSTKSTPQVSAPTETMDLPYFCAASARPFWISAQSRSTSQRKRTGQVHWSVGEPMDFLQAQSFAVPQAGHDAAAFGAKINCEINLLA